jgi:chromosomal replication initiator protein
MSIDLWQRGCERLAVELPEQQFNTWIRPLPPAAVCTEVPAKPVVSVRVSNRFKLDWIRTQYANRIETVLSDIAGRPVRLELSLAARVAPPRPLALAGAQPAPATPSGGPLNGSSRPAAFDHHAAPPPSATRHHLNSALTFDTLVAGRANQMARTAALHVAGAPGRCTTRCSSTAAWAWARRTWCTPWATRC